MCHIEATLNKKRYNYSVRYEPLLTGTFVRLYVHEYHSLIGGNID